MYQIWCNGAVWSGLYPLREALKRVGKLSERPDLQTDRAEWVIRLVRVDAKKD